MKKVAIIMGSISDWKVMQEACIILKNFNIDYHAEIVSAHRTPEKMYEFAKSADVEFEVIIAGAGGSAHLPGMVASLTTIPVIGIPIKSKYLKGIDSLYSIVNMPFGTPVATVGINAAKNAALLAVKILAIKHQELNEDLIAFKNQMIEDVEDHQSELIIETEDTSE